MKPSSFLCRIACICVSFLILSACSLSALSSAPAPQVLEVTRPVPTVPAATIVPGETQLSTVDQSALPEYERPPFWGIWRNESGEILILTEKSIYHHFIENDNVYEHFAEIQSFDLEKGQINYFLHRIRINGSDVGFDAPNNMAIFQLDNGSLNYQVLVEPTDPSLGIRYETALKPALSLETASQEGNLVGDFSGIWIGERGQVVVIDPAFFYHRFFENDLYYEHIARIDSIDLETGDIYFTLRSILIDGKGYGFDSPNIKANARVSDGFLYYNEFVAPEDPAAGIRYALVLERSFVGQSE